MYHNTILSNMHMKAVIVYSTMIKVHVPKMLPLLYDKTFSKDDCTGMFL